MSDAVEVAIPRALLRKTAQFAAAQNPALTVSYPNTDFTVPQPSKNTQWLRATHMPADTATLGIGITDINQHYGIYQIDVFQGQGIGEPAPGRVASAIIEYFARGTRLTLDGFDVDIVRSPFRGPMIKDDPWVFIPVRIPYLCLASPA